MINHSSASKESPPSTCSYYCNNFIRIFPVRIWVVLPSPGVGHFTPPAEFARKLHLHHHLHVTLFATAMDPGAAQATQQSIIDSLPPSLITCPFFPSTHQIPFHRKQIVALPIFFSKQQIRYNNFTRPCQRVQKR